MLRVHGNKEASSLIRTSGTLVSRLQPPRHLLPICMVPTSQLLVGSPLHIRWWHGSLFLSISIVHFWNTPPHVVYLFFPHAFQSPYAWNAFLCSSGLLVFFFFCSAVIDENELETTEHHEVRMKNIRWHLAEGIFALLFWCFVSPNYDAVAQQLHDLQKFLEFLSGSFVFRIDCSSLISFHHRQDKMMLLMQQVLHFCIWGNAIYTRKICSFSFWPEFPSIFCRRI